MDDVMFSDFPVEVIVSQRLFTAWRKEEMDNVCQCVHACVRACVLGCLVANCYLTRANDRCRIFFHISLRDTAVR